MLNSESSTQYIFFPVKSRFTFNGSKEGNDQSLQVCAPPSPLSLHHHLCFLSFRLYILTLIHEQEAVNRVVIKDLELDRIWRGFGSPSHLTFAGAQFVIGKSTENFTKETTGSDWHCAGGNNW